MTALSKSQVSFSTAIYRAISYAILITLLVAIICLGVTESKSPVNRTSFRRRYHRVTTIPTTTTTESIDNYSGSIHTNVDKLRNETALEMTSFQHKNLSYSLCRKTHDIRCQEKVYKSNLLFTRQKASAIQLIKQRLIAHLKGNESRNSNDTLKTGTRLSPKRRPNRRSKLHRNKRAATSEESRFWDHGTIPYSYDTNFTVSEKMTFALAMTIWEKNSCVTFKEKDDSDTDYIVFTVRPCGCCSHVGRKGGGAQPVSLGQKCRLTGIVLHELGHAIGFWHEHTRPDRDKYVEVFLEHVLESKESNFNKMKSDEVNSLGEPYDFDSIMHYGRNTLARNAYQDTILPKRLPGYPVRPDIGQRSYLSPGDIKQVNKLYKCASCGQTLHEHIGTISHKSTPGKPETCHWRIRVAYGERVKLNITALGIPKSKDCKTGHLDVRDGANAASPRIGLYCGDTLPGVLHSTGRRMWLEYKTLRGDGTGFNASYVRECGGEINGTEGVIMSPSYNEYYLPKLNCTWVITIDPNYILLLNFEAFQLENDSGCKYDYLEIREGITDSDPLIGRYCGFKYPSKLNSTASKIQFRFVTDSELQRSGFHISFVKEIDECQNETHDCEHVCINTVGSYLCECVLGYELKPDGKSCEKACGGIINTPNGTISSPFFPNPYPAGKTCEWIIEAPQNNTIFLTFTHFDLEATHDGICSFDYVKVHPEGGANRYNSILLCGETLPEPITSKGNTMKVVFRSDNYDQKPGFFAVFSSDTNECEFKNGGCQHICTNTVGSFYCSCRNGFILQDDQRGCVEGCYTQINDYQGTITSPNYPDNYPVNTECEWLLIAPIGHRVRLDFQHFSLEPQNECKYDNLALFDGDNVNASLIGRYCGSIFPELVISKSSMMLVSFMSDLSVQRKGFEAFHDTVCGGFLEATFSSQSVTSHVNYGILNYDTWEECEWLIQAQEGFRVEIEFESFNLEYHQDCEYDSVTVYDGNEVTSPVKKTFCGNTLPDPIVSGSSSLLVRFTTDNTINKKGFKFDFKKVVNVPKKLDLVD